MTRILGLDRSRFGAALCVVAALMVAGACGDDDDSSAEPETGGRGGTTAGRKSAGAGAAPSAGKSGASGAGGTSRAGASAAGSGGRAADEDGGVSQFDPQIPPEDVDDMEAWLAAGYYKAWACEAKPTKKTDGAPAIHAHGGMNRVCSNLQLSAAKLEDGGEFPKGVASVKELYSDSGELEGTAVTVKVEDESAEGRGWYYWEGKRISGRGIAGCANCHSAAGSDDDHPGAGDFVYFRNP
jgi:hypothetical protein